MSKEKKTSPSIGARIREFFRRKIVSLKRNPSMIPMVMLVVAFLEFSLNLTSFSNTTAKIQGSGMGLSQFTIMLLSILSVVCLLNSFPRRKKANVPMIVVMFVMFAVIIFCDIYYNNAIYAAVTRAENPIVIDSSTAYISKAYSLLQVHVVLVCVTAALVALLPVYSKLLKKIKTSVEVEDNGEMDEIEIAE
ncbi:MAG: hypothetical protein LUJ09_04285 [Firmicutes bacterium]|nr:hypothetical protein [Bacillota bacterium]